MPKYNLAYSPSDNAFAETCIAFAAKHFGILADGYCLNAVNALPHVVLNRFETDEAKLDSLWKQAAQLCPASLEIAFHCVDLRPGDGSHAGYVWAELVARRDSSLITCQKKITDMLTAAHIEPRMPSGDHYHPYLALARLARVPKEETPLWYDKAGLNKRHKFHLTLGLSNDNDVCLQILQP